MTELTHEGYVKSNPHQIITVTGRCVAPLALEVEDVVLQDIAHALARTCRYGGHAEGHLSVARHSIWVAEKVHEWGGDLVTRLWGLLHDAAEAYLGDMTKPLKYHPAMRVFRDAEDQVTQTIARRFDLPWPMPDLVVEADRAVTVEQELPYPHGARYTWFGSGQGDLRDFLEAYEGLTS